MRRREYTLDIYLCIFDKLWSEQLFFFLRGSNWLYQLRGRPGNSPGSHTGLGPHAWRHGPRGPTSLPKKIPRRTPWLSWRRRQRPTQRHGYLARPNRRPPHAAWRASAASAAAFLDPSIISPTPALIPARFLSRAVRRLRRRHRERGWWRPRLALFPMASSLRLAAPITAASYASRRSRAPASAPPVFLRAEAAAPQVNLILIASPSY